MADDAKDEQAAHVAAQAAQIAAARPSRAQAAPATDVADDAPDGEPDEDAAKAKDLPPRVWLIYNPKSGRRYNHIPTQGSGKDGELTPHEVRAYFRTRAVYDEATGRGADGKQEPMYLRAHKADLRPNQPYVGEPVKEEAANGES